MSVTQGNQEYQPFVMNQEEHPSGKPLHELQPDVMKIEELQNQHND